MAVTMQGTVSIAARELFRRSAHRAEAPSSLWPRDAHCAFAAHAGAACGSQQGAEQGSGRWTRPSHRWPTSAVDTRQAAGRRSWAEDVSSCVGRHNGWCASSTVMGAPWTTALFTIVRSRTVPFCVFVTSVHAHVMCRKVGHLHANRHALANLHGCLPIFQRNASSPSERMRYSVAKHE